jgi:hypothetical protein
LPGHSSGTCCWSKAGGGWRYGSQEVLGWITLGLLGLTLAGYLWRVVSWKPRAER